MLQILGLGFASPESRLNNQLLSELNPEFNADHFENETGIKDRRSLLRLEYLQQTGNADIRQAPLNLAESDLLVAERAVNQALVRAGINADQIGLVIGETSTPFQTIPALAQRVAGQLGLKVKAYDLLAGAASPCLHINTLNSWRPERLPQYTLLVYSNFPTAFINYSAITPNLAEYSDSVAAIVVGKGSKGKLSVLSASFFSDNSSQHAEGIDLFSPLIVSDSIVKTFASRLSEVGGLSLDKNPRGSAKNYFLPSQISPSLVKQLGQELGFKAEEIMLSSSGNSFSSAPFEPLSRYWDGLGAGDRIYMALSGFGLQYGEVVMEVN